MSFFNYINNRIQKGSPEIQPVGDALDKDIYSTYIYISQASYNFDNIILYMYIINQNILFSVKVKKQPSITSNDNIENQYNVHQNNSVVVLC